MFPQTIEHLLVERKVSKSELAYHLESSRSTLNDYLSGKVPMPSDRIQKTADFFGVSVGYLFGETSDRAIEFQTIYDLLVQQQKQINNLVEIVNNKNKKLTQKT